VGAKPFVFFDLGGTLIDLRGIVASMAERLDAGHVRSPVSLALDWAIGTAKLLPSSQGRKFRPEREIASDVLSALLEKRGRPDARGESEQLVVDAWNGFVRTCSFHSDASAGWLQGLRSKVAGLGLVTDGDTEAVQGILRRLGIAHLFDAVTASEEVRSYKPDTRIYRAALKALRAKAPQSLFVSDSALDLKGAASIGIAGAWISRGLLPEVTPTPPGTAVLSSLRDLEGIIRRFSRSGRFVLG
jgi:2-haloalkanoic acid dehalogenase type II